MLSLGALVPKGAILAAAAGRAEAKAVLRFRASRLLCNTENHRYCVEHFMISFFFPKLFILVTASPFYAARRDKNAGRNVVRIPVISCRCEGHQSTSSEAMLLAALPRSFAAAGGLLASDVRRIRNSPFCRAPVTVLVVSSKQRGALHGDLLYFCSEF